MYLLLLTYGPKKESEEKMERYVMSYKGKNQQCKIFPLPKLTFKLN